MVTPRVDGKNGGHRLADDSPPALRNVGVLRGSTRGFHARCSSSPGLDVVPLGRARPHPGRACPRRTCSEACSARAKAAGTGTIPRARAGACTGGETCASAGENSGARAGACSRGQTPRAYGKSTCARSAGAKTSCTRDKTPGSRDKTGRCSQTRDARDACNARAESGGSRETGRCSQARDARDARHDECAETSGCAEGQTRRVRANAQRKSGSAAGGGA